MRNRYVFYLMLAAMLAAGCGDDSPTGPSSSPGEWSAKVTGDVSMEMSGQAVFNSQGFDPVTGRVQITTAATNAFGGEFELTARTTDFDNEGEKFVEVKGDFSAIGIF